MKWCLTWWKKPPHPCLIPLKRGLISMVIWRYLLTHLKFTRRVSFVFLPIVRYQQDASSQLSRWTCFFSSSRIISPRPQLPRFLTQSKKIMTIIIRTKLLNNWLPVNSVFRALIFFFLLFNFNFRHLKKEKRMGLNSLL